MTLKYSFLFILALLSISSFGKEADTTFVKGVDLYYGHYSGETPYTYFNHQIWLTTTDLIFDGDGIEGKDGRVMRLDLFNNSATDITGSYEIVGPKYADQPGCINKKFTYYTYFQDGAFYERKLTEGTCTIQCVTSSTYDITYDVQEINNGAKHKQTLHNIPISAIFYKDNSLYTLTNDCKSSAIERVVSSMDADKSHKVLYGNSLILEVNGKKYTLFGQQISL